MIKYINMEVYEPNDIPWLLTALYANPREGKSRVLWEDILHFSNSVSRSWLMVGDINVVSKPSEQKGGAEVDIQKCIDFHNWINDCHLMDLGFVGSRFSWRGPKWQGGDKIFKRLDRALCNVNWRLRFHEAIDWVLPRVQSDHQPLCIQL